MSEKRTVNIHGKDYETVASRVERFRKDNKEYGIETEILFNEGDTVVLKALIKNKDGRILATGHAEEKRGSSQINKTSALENAETSAIGRCLACLGYIGTEFATADEVANAIHQQTKTAKPTKADAYVKPKAEADPVKGSATNAQKARIHLLKAEQEVSDEDYSKMKAVYGVTSSVDLDSSDALQLIVDLENLKDTVSGGITSGQRVMINQSVKIGKLKKNVLDSYIKTLGVKSIDELSQAQARELMKEIK